jgi:hypothetical protein
MSPSSVHAGSGLRAFRTTVPRSDLGRTGAAVAPEENDRGRGTFPSISRYRVCPSSSKVSLKSHVALVPFIRDGGFVLSVGRSSMPGERVTRTFSKATGRIAMICYICGPCGGNVPLTEVAELVDAHVSGACNRKVVRVRVPPSVLRGGPPRTASFTSCLCGPQGSGRSIAL